MATFVYGPVARHTKNVKGSPFKTAANIYAPGKIVFAPFDAKIPHVYKDKTKCGNPGPGSAQFVLGREELNAKGDRHLTKDRMAVAHIVPVANLPRHVKKDAPLGTVSGDTLHISTNSPELMDAVT